MRIKFHCCSILLALFVGQALAQAVVEFPAGDSRPYDIALGPDGNLWFTSANPRIGRIAPDGTITTFSDGLTAGAYGIAAGPDGNLWFVGIGYVGRITPTGAVTLFRNGIADNAYLRDIVAGPDGNLWFTDFGASRKPGRIGRITVDGVVTFFSDGLSPTSNPTQITVGPDGNLWFSQDNVLAPDKRVGRIAPDGVIVEFVVGRYNPTSAITAGPDGNLWLTTSGTIVRLTPSGVVTEFKDGITPTGQGNAQLAITSGTDGNLWFTQTSANRVARITPDGVVTEFAQGITVPIGGGAGPVGIALGADGNVWFALAGTGRIGRISTSRRLVEYYNASLDHYFMTWVPDEIAALDAGTRIKGWTRTGLSVNAYGAPPVLSAVCRYYIPPPFGDTHFFGRDAQECAATAARYPSFVLEAAGFVQVRLPNAGECTADTNPVYRVWNGRVDTNHRYTTSRAIRDQMLQQGWVAEGDGIDRVTMCAPL